MIYLTGAGASLAKTSSNPQSDAGKSLGGYISSTPVPNSALNTLFDLLSAYTLEKRQKETIAIGLINQFDYPVKDVELKIVTNDDNEAIFKVAAVSVDPTNYLMEYISSRYQEPLNAEFYDASFYRASVEFEVKSSAIAGEEIVLYPFNVVVEVLESGMEGTWNAFEEAFSNNNTYTIKRVTENIFRIERQDETVLALPLDCSYLSSETFSAEFLGKFGNKADNSVLIKDILQPKQAIGIWIQRQIKKNRYATDEELINEFLQKYVRNDSEEVELIISYNLVEDETKYNQEYQPESYS
jgi:hypothetical protein